MSPHSALDQLRSHTSQAHARLEAADFVLPSTRDRQHYGTLIGAMLAFHTSLEEHFHAHESALCDAGLQMQHRYRSRTLQGEARELRAPAVVEPELTYASAAHVAGAVYVMEGSTLGGLLIGKSVLDHLGFRSAYYGEFGATTASRWRETGAQLEIFAHDEDRIDAMLGGAADTFDALYVHLGAALGERCLETR